MMKESHQQQPGGGHKKLPYQQPKRAQHLDEDSSNLLHPFHVLERRSS